MVFQVKKIMTPFHPFVTKLASSWPAESWQTIPIIVAVSGGPDSVALLRALVELKEQSDKTSKPPGEVREHPFIIVGHFNHCLRPEQADADQAFVESLCEHLGIPCETGHADVRQLAEQQGDGIESAARKIRYDFLLSLAEKHGARYVLTGHTADDQAETILHRIVRGTGLRGLAGMPRARSLSPAVSLLRPMLTIERSTVHAYLDQIEQPFCTDASNSDPAFTRNRIRKKLLPLIQKEFNPQAAAALLRLGQLAGDVQRLVDQIAERQLAECVTRSSPETICLDGSRLDGLDDSLIRELLIQIWRDRDWPLQAMGHREWESLAEMSQCDTDATTTLPGGILAKKQDGQLSLTRPA
jgi:tRNA(Ile)-lysidine synthase